MPARPGGLGGTYAGNPVACAAALAVLEVFDEERIFERAERARRTHRQGRSTRLAARHPEIVDVRRLGAMIAFELGEGGDPHRPAADLTKKLTVRARELGLILLSCGIYGNVVRILVPITAEDAVVDEGLGILAESGVGTAVRRQCDSAAASPGPVSDSYCNPGRAAMVPPDPGLIT